MTKCQFCLFVVVYCATPWQFDEITEHKMKSATFLHRNCRNAIYPQSQIERTFVGDHLVPWTTQFTDYQPKDYESPAIEGKSWADPKISKFRHFA